jgi:Cu-Zn family superoxide dismutase
MKMRAVVAIGCAMLAANCSRKVRPGTAPTEPTAFTDSENPVVSALPGEPSSVREATLERESREAGNVFIDPGARQPVAAMEAIAVMRPTAENQAIGVVRFRVVENGDVEVLAAIDGLPEGAHAYHVHLFGDCSAIDASSAGPHFNYTGSSLDPDVPMITGNLGDLLARGKRTTTHHARIPGATLQGPFSIIGRSVVIHEHPNDPAVTPDGGAGRRIACGVIGVANPQPAPQQTARR